MKMSIGERQLGMMLAAQRVAEIEIPSEDRSSILSAQRLADRGLLQRVATGGYRYRITSRGREALEGPR